MAAGIGFGDLDAEAAVKAHVVSRKPAEITDFLDFARQAVVFCIGRLFGQKAQAFRAERDPKRCAFVALNGVVDLNFTTGIVGMDDCVFFIIIDKRSFDQIDLTQEVRGKAAVGIFIKLERGAKLTDHAFIHHGNA